MNLPLTLEEAKQRLAFLRRPALRRGRIAQALIDQEVNALETILWLAERLTIILNEHPGPVSVADAIDELADWLGQP